MNILIRDGRNQFPPVHEVDVTALRKNAATLKAGATIPSIDGGSDFVVEVSLPGEMRISRRQKQGKSCVHYCVA